MRRKKKGIRLIYLIVLIIMLVLLMLLKIPTKTIEKEIIKSGKILNVQDSMEYDVIDYMYENTDISTYNQTISTFSTGKEKIEPHIDEETNVKYITYEDIGTVATGEDAYEIMNKTHKIANIYGYEVRATLSEYHIYKLEDLEPIYIQTNTNWNNAKFIIHDENIKGTNVKDYAIIKIISNEQEIVVKNSSVLNNIKINKETKKVEELAGYGNCLCLVYNSNKKQFIRSGLNENSGNDQIDLFRIDNEGNLLNEVQWDFENITKIKLIPIPEEQIIVQNGNFQTNLDREQYEQTSGYWNRNIICNRSNTIIKNINHSLDDENCLGGPYFGFIRISYVTEVQMIDCEIVPHKYENASNYDLILEYSSNITLNNITSNYLENEDRWGITGTNYTKDITYINCKLNRIDAHCGIHNLTIQDCVVGIKGITVVGSGKLKIDNTIKLGGNSLVALRTDYGCTWDGDIEINNCQYDIKKNNRLINFTASYDSDGKIHDFGYDLVLPNIYMNNLEIINSQNEDDYVYIIFNTAKYVGNKDSNILEAGYVLPEKIIVENYSIEGEKILKDFYKDFEGKENIEVAISAKKIEKPNYKIEDNYIKNITLKTNVQTFKENIEDENILVTRNGETLNEEDILSTGDEITNQNETYRVVVTGDVYPDGNVNISDLMKTKRKVSGSIELVEEQKMAADINEDNNINIIDVMKIVRIILQN